ncbi:hypothetical protein BST45_05805 [Mycobacterium shinjukuense]|nr:hypothetical protein BST45_05805 [Mycobacterium shinjukuense]
MVFMTSVRPAIRSPSLPRQCWSILDGQPVQEPSGHREPFVMNTGAGVCQAFEDYHAGKFRSIPPNARMRHRGGGTLRKCRKRRVAGLADPRRPKPTRRASASCAPRVRCSANAATTGRPSRRSPFAPT